MRKSLQISLFDELIVRSWWVILFVNLCYIAYEQAQVGRNHLYMNLNHQLNTLTEEKERALSLQKKLALQQNSQHDPAWIELILMERLGMVPDGSIKVFFTENP